MTIIQPKKTRRAFISPALAALTCGIIFLAATNVVAYDRIVGTEHSVAERKTALESAHAENTELKKQWYQALGDTNIKTLVKEYGFVKVASPGYLPS